MLWSFIAQSLPTPPDDGITYSTDIIDKAKSSAEIVVNSFEGDWQRLLAGEDPVYFAIIKVCIPLATIGVAWWSLPWIANIAERGLTIEVINAVIWPVLVALMLAYNNGLLLATTAYTLHKVDSSLNAQLLDNIRSGISRREAIRETHIDQGLSQQLAKDLEDCATMPTAGTDKNGNPSNIRKNCEDKASEKAIQDSRQYREANGIPSTGTGFDWANPGTLVNNVVQAGLFAFLSACEACAVWVINKSFLLVTYTGPFALLISLPMSSGKPIWVWLNGWLACTLWQLLYNVIIGDIATTTVLSSQTNPLIMPLMEGIIAPFITAAIAGFSAFGLSAIISSLGRTIVERAV